MPVRYRGYWYASRFVSGGQYPVDRAPGGPAASAAEVVLLDCNALAVGQPFFQLGGYEASPDNTLLAYAEDTVGRRQFRIRFKDIASGELLGDVIENAEADVAWADDNRTLLYVEKDPVTLLGRRVRAHVLGTPVSADRLVYEEPDESFDLVVMRSKSERHLYIGSESTTTSEWRYARAGDPSLTFAVVVPRDGGPRIPDRRSRRAPADSHQLAGARTFASWPRRSLRAATVRAGAMWCRTTPRCSCNRWKCSATFSR